MTPAQLTTVKNFIVADGTLNAQPTDGGGLGFIADALNALAAPDFMVWRTDAPVGDILDAITWVNYTPADSPEATGIFTARAMVIQTKQMNLQSMLIGRSSIDASKANVRAGLRDCVIAIPAGASGAAIVAGGSSGSTVLTACTRKARVIEKLLITSSPATGTVTAGLMGFEGMISPNEVDTARRS